MKKKKLTNKELENRIDILLNKIVAVTNGIDFTHALITTYIKFKEDHEKFKEFLDKENKKNEQTDRSNTEGDREDKSGDTNSKPESK
jgi:hypothetical protein